MQVEEEKKSKFDTVFGSIEAFYKKVLAYCIGHRKTTVGIVVLSVVLTLSLATLLGASLFPNSDQGQISISIETPAGSPLSENRVCC